MAQKQDKSNSLHVDVFLNIMTSQIELVTSPCISIGISNEIVAQHASLSIDSMRKKLVKNILFLYEIYYGGNPLIQTIRFLYAKEMVLYLLLQF